MTKQITQELARTIYSRYLNGTGIVKLALEYGITIEQVQTIVDYMRVEEHIG